VAITTKKKAAKAITTLPALVHDAQVTSLINLAARLTAKAARVRLGEMGAWPGQIPILLWLIEEDGMIQKDLVAKSNMEQSTVAEHLDRMEQNELIFRKRGDEDKRTYRIFLTKKAKAMSGELLAGLESGARTFTQGIEKDDLVVFDRVIRKVIANLDGFVRKAAAKSDDKA
jgi:DNA-binding MarR family transcriptional regulator